MAPDKLYFHADSAAVPPGKGVHEQVADPARYSPLWLSAARWREALSDAWPVELMMPPRPGLEGGGGEEYTPPLPCESVEHCMKLAWQYPVFRRLDAAGQIPQLHRVGFTVFCQQHNRSHMTNLTWLRMTQLEETNWNAGKEEFRTQCQWLKFSEHAELRGLLLATGDAQLWEVMARGKKPAERAWELERVRKALREGRTELPAAVEDEDAAASGEG